MVPETGKARMMALCLTPLSLWPTHWGFSPNPLARWSHRLHTFSWNCSTCPPKGSFVSPLSCFLVYFLFCPHPPPPKFSTSARCLENCTHPLRCSSTAPSSQLSWSPEGASQRACGNSFLTATPILTVPSGCCLGYPGTRGKQNGQHRFQLVYTLGFHLQLFLKDGQSSIKRRKVWIWLSFSKLPWRPYTKLPFPSRCSKHLLKSALESVPGAVWWSFCLLCTFISHLKKADNLVPASSLWVHLPLTTQSFIYLTDLYWAPTMCKALCLMQKIQSKNGK